MFFTGLFLPFYGQMRNYPIVRFGRVAMVAEERIPWKQRDGTDDLLELYLVETQAFGGNSGSPVFFYLGSDREPGRLIVGPPVLKLAGIMKGYFSDAQRIRMLDAQQTPLSIQNIGIAAVIPSYLLHEILLSDELMRQRTANE